MKWRKNSSCLKIRHRSPTLSFLYSRSIYFQRINFLIDQILALNISFFSLKFNFRLNYHFKLLVLSVVSHTISFNYLETKMSSQKAITLIIRIFPVLWTLATWLTLKYPVENVNGYLEICLILDYISYFRAKILLKTEIHKHIIVFFSIISNTENLAIF